MLRNEQTTQKIFIAQTNLFGLWQTKVKLDLAELKKFDISIDNNLKAKIKPYLVKEISALQTRLDNFHDDYQCQVNKKAAVSIVIAMAIGLILGGCIAAMATCINNKDDCSTS